MSNRETPQLSPRAAGGWQTLRAHISHYLVVRCIAWLDLGARGRCPSLPCLPHKPESAQGAAKEQYEGSDADDERDNIWNRPWFEAARAQEILVMEGLVGCARKPRKEDRGGKRIEAGHQAIHPAVESPLCDVRRDNHSESQSKPNLKDRISQAERRIQCAVDRLLGHGSSWHG